MTQQAIESDPQRTRIRTDAWNPVCMRPDR